MFEIQYKSKGGIIVIGGGSNPLFNVTSLSGFDFPTREFTTVTFAGENGVTTTGKKDSARTLTVAGDLCGSADDISRACKAFYYDGELICIFGDVRRKIACKCTKLDDFVRYTRSGFASFAVQFVADYPYFTNVYQTTTPLFSQKNLVTTTFTLPCVFTQRISAADIINAGDKIVYPTLYIKNVGAAAVSAADLTITNDTTGAVIKLENYLTAENETITVNLATRRITSDVSGNITNYISNDTDLSKFYLEIGKNHISFVNDSGQHINATAVYNAEYITAVR